MHVYNFIIALNSFYYPTRILLFFLINLIYKDDTIIPLFLQVMLHAFHL